MIRTFRSKELAALWAGKRSRIDLRFHKRILVRLDRLNSVSTADDMNHLGYDFHGSLAFGRNDTPSTSTARGASHLNSEKVTLTKSIGSNITDAWTT